MHRLVVITMEGIRYLVYGKESLDEAKELAKEIGTIGYFGYDPDKTLFYLPAHRIDRILIEPVKEDDEHNSKNG